MLKMETPQDIRSPGFDMSPRTRALTDYFAVVPLKSELASIQEQEPPSYELNGSDAHRRESTISFQDELPTRRSSTGTDSASDVTLGRKLSTSSISSRRPRYSASLHGQELQEHALRIRASSPPPQRFVVQFFLFLFFGLASRLGMRITSLSRPHTVTFVCLGFILLRSHSCFSFFSNHVRKFGTLDRPSLRRLRHFLGTLGKLGAIAMDAEASTTSPSAFGVWDNKVRPTSPRHPAHQIFHFFTSAVM
ncbi:hypothetical protein NQ176_g5462 [Zarea fungicola]|uniref:Uncharacterized protein n=1 Tax=Zarea fungicola TaxID=93591 RepID=A0ACC1N9K6_9HYPO|nr:hypothetical protein NQ176_g5462 [Lecanicillium fungicola]